MVPCFCALREAVFFHRGAPVIPQLGGISHQVRCRNKANAGVAQKIRNNFWDYRLHVVPPPIRNPAAPQPMRCHQTYVSSKYLHPLFFKSPIFFFRCSGGHSKSVAMQPTQRKRAAVPPCRCRQKAISSFVIGAPQAAQASCFIFLSPTDGGKNPSQLSVPSTGSSPPRRPSHGCPQTCRFRSGRGVRRSAKG